MDNSKNGFILVTVMCLLFLATLLAISSAKISFILAKQTQAQWRYWQVNNALIRANRLIAERVISHQPIACLQSYRIDNAYFSQSLKSAPVCKNTENKIISTSVVEKLPESGCLQQEQVIFYRITTQSRLDPSLNMKGQSSVAVLMVPKVTCNNPVGPLSLGIQSWHRE